MAHCIDDLTDGIMHATLENDRTHSGLFSPYRTHVDLDYLNLLRMPCAPPPSLAFAPQRHPVASHGVASCEQDSASPPLAAAIKSSYDPPPFTLEPAVRIPPPSAVRHFVIRTHPTNAARPATAPHVRTISMLSHLAQHQTQQHQHPQQQQQQPHNASDGATVRTIRAPTANASDCPTTIRACQGWDEADAACRANNRRLVGLFTCWPSGEITWTGRAWLPLVLHFFQIDATGIRPTDGARAWLSKGKEANFVLDASHDQWEQLMCANLTYTHLSANKYKATVCVVKL